MSLFEKTFDRAIYLDKEFKIVSQPDDENLTIELMGDDGLVFEANLSMVSLLKIKAEPKEISFTMNKSCSNCKNAYYQDVTNDLDDDVYSCDEFESSFININDSGRPKDFSCNKWESK